MKSQSATQSWAKEQCQSRTLHYLLSKYSKRLQSLKQNDTTQRHTLLPMQQDTKPEINQPVDCKLILTIVLRTLNGERTIYLK